VASNDPDKPKPERPTFIVQARETATSDAGLYVFRVLCSLVVILALTQAPMPAQLAGLWALTLLALSLGRRPR
jgi:hypothetical protein